MPLCKRIIGAILIENGLVVRRENFKTTSIIGRPEITFKYLQNWNIDEVFLINVGKKCDMSPVIRKATNKIFVPVTVGGSIDSIEEVHKYLNEGADKIVIGKHASKELLDTLCSKYGDQAISLSIDENHENLPDYRCGEIILHDKTRDGSGEGLNIDILKKTKTNKPVIAMGGVGNYNHIVEGLKYADAVCVGNLFHFKEVAALEAKKHCVDIGLDVRL